MAWAKAPKCPKCRRCMVNLVSHDGGRPDKSDPAEYWCDCDVLEAARVRLGIRAKPVRLSCLRCERFFQSVAKANRLCQKCRATADGTYLPVYSRLRLKTRED